MAPLPDYVTGTITLTNGSPNFTGDGTGWLAAGFREGDTILGIEDNEGVVYVIESITDNDAGTLTQDWQGATGTYAYRMRYLSDGQRVTAQARQLIELLGNGNLQAVAGLPGTPQTLMMFTGPGAMVEVPRTDLVSGAAYDVQVDTLADRDAYDSADVGFAVLVANVGDGRAAIYSKLSNAVGDWSAPAYVTGGSLDVTVGSVTELDYGEAPTITGTPGPGTLELDFGLPGGPVLSVGAVTRGDADVTSTPVTGGYELDFTIPSQVAQGNYSGATAYVKGDVVQYQGSSWVALQATTGNTPPSLPTTSNAYWQLLARAGADGAGTVTTVVAGDGIFVDSTDPTEPIVSLDILGESVKTTNYTLVAADYGGTFIADDTDPIEFAFEAAATLGAKWWAVVKNIGAGDLTLNPSGSETIDGLTELVLKQGQSCLVTCNGSELRSAFHGGGVDDDFTLPSGTTATRPDPATNGMVRYNEDLDIVEAYIDGAWRRLQDTGLPYEVEYLVVAGGGGGGYGGGGGGGLLEDTTDVIPGDSYTVTVGAGGAGGEGSAPSSNGSNSVFGAVTAVGGGRGQRATYNIAGDGGSGGGGGAPDTAGGTGTGGQGNNGGTGTGTNGVDQTGGGGGGAGAAGQNAASAGTAGNGGAGVNSSISGAEVGYAGGGGGGVVSGTPGTASHGGGAGGTNSATNGTANRGGGGGGASIGPGGTGGSGIVIVRYLGDQRGTGGTVTSSGGYTIHTFTGSGTFTA